MDSLCRDFPQHRSYPRRHDRGLCLGPRIPTRLLQAPALLGLARRPLVPGLSGQGLGLFPSVGAQRQCRAAGRLVHHRKVRRGKEARGRDVPAAVDALLQLSRAEVQRQRRLPLPLALDGLLLPARDRRRPQGRRSAVRHLVGRGHALQVLRGRPAVDLPRRGLPSSPTQALLRIRLPLSLGGRRGTSGGTPCLVAHHHRISTDPLCRRRSGPDPAPELVQRCWLPIGLPGPAWVGHSRCGPSQPRAGQPALAAARGAEPGPQVPRSCGPGPGPGPDYRGCRHSFAVSARRNHVGRDLLPRSLAADGTRRRRGRCKAIAPCPPVDGGDHACRLARLAPRRLREDEPRRIDCCPTSDGNRRGRNPALAAEDRHAIGDRCRLLSLCRCGGVLQPRSPFGVHRLRPRLVSLDHAGSDRPPWVPRRLPEGR